MIVGMLPRLACIEATDSHTREEGKDGKMCGQSRNTFHALPGSTLLDLAPQPTDSCRLF